VKVLLDTHIFYWTFYERAKQPALATKLMLEAEAVYVSAASLWEIAIKVRLGKVKADLEEMIATIAPAGFLTLPVTTQHAVQIARLPLHHADPFDRMLVAQAVSQPLYLLTVDGQLPQYSSLVIHV
jgi:PIN domain nuclease of toxin-antitoxin system